MLHIVDVLCWMQLCSLDPVEGCSWKLHGNSHLITLVARVNSGERGLSETRSFQLKRAPFLEISEICFEQKRESRESPQSMEKQGESDHSLEILKIFQS